jgi:hypothetical protein
MKPRILLVNPPIFDFSAYDFWLKPYGLLRVGGFLRGQAEFALFDYLDRAHPSTRQVSDEWGRGHFPSADARKPAIFAEVPRRFHRFGWPREFFRSFISNCQPFDVALVQTVMTYWYPGVAEVIDDLRARSPLTKIVLGGVYATLCPEHARNLEADLVVEGSRFDEFERLLGLRLNPDSLPVWDLYPKLEVGILKLAYGCPFRCTYCSVPRVQPVFAGYPLERSLAECDWLCRLGVRNIAFYDDALLYRPAQVLVPFLEEVIRRRLSVHFHTPNALNARFIDRELATLMVTAGFRNFYIGFESAAYDWQHRTGGKVYSHELVRAVKNLRAAGASPSSITAYLIIGHPNSDHQEVEASMRLANSQGIRVMLSEFSPIPGTPDGESCRQFIDLDEPLCHNKTAFTSSFLGSEKVNALKSLCHELNADCAEQGSGSRDQGTGNKAEVGSSGASR